MGFQIFGTDHLNHPPSQDVVRLAAKANEAANTYRDMIRRRKVGFVAGRRLIEAVDALTTAIADEACR